MSKKTVSLDQIMSERQFSVRRTASGAESLTKVYKAPTTWNAEARSARFVMTAEVVDRYGDVVVTKGGDINEFVRNPVALWAHDSRDFPIGLWDDIIVVNGSPKRMEGTVTLSEEDTTEEADTVAKLLAQGMVRACSIGFMPKAWESIKDEKDRWTGYKFMEWELLECSVCSIPANPAALAKAAGGKEGLALQAIELVLDEWARTPAGLIVPRSEYERAYQIVKDKEITLHEVRAIDESPEVEINELDIEAAVSRGIEKASVSIMSKIAEMFGVKAKTEETTPVVEATVEEKTADPAVEQSVEDEGETEEQFQARMAAAKAVEDQLADEAEELALRARAAEVA